MAILSGPPSPRKAPSLTGKVYVSTYRGQVVLRKWPSRRARPLNQKTQEQAEWFRQAGILANYLTAEQQIAAREAAKGTPVYPRDLLVMMMRGTLVAIKQEDGRILYSVATRQAVSESLDALSQDPRTVLVRNGDLWVPVTSDQDNQVLLSQSTSPFFRFDAVPGPNNAGSSVIATTSVGFASQIAIQGLTLPVTGQLEIRLSDVRVQSGSGSLWIQVEQAAAWTNFGYYWNLVVHSSNNAWYRIGLQNQPVFDLARIGAFEGVSNAANATLGGVLRMTSLSTSHYPPFQSTFSYHGQNGQGVYCFNGGNLQNTGAITGFRVVSSAGNLLNARMTILHLE